LRTLLRYFLIAILSALVLAAILYFVWGGPGRREANLQFPGNQSLLLFAHRGLGNYFPENSMEGFEAALSSGFKAIETDIRLSADDTLVIFHDENCLRLLGVDTPLHTLSTAILKESRIVYNGAPSSSKVMTVDDFFGSIKDRLVVYLDVKPHDKRTAEKISALILKHHLESSTIVANSNMLFIASIENMHPEINTVLEGFTPGKEWIYNLLPKNLKPDFLASFEKDVNAEHMDWFSGKKIIDRKIVYGVDKENFRQAINAGVQKIVMDFDSTLREEIIKYR